MHTPALRHIVREHFGLDGELNSLPGERDLNFRLHGTAGVDYVVKVSDPARSSEELDFRQALLQVLAKAGLDFETPLSTSSSNGEAIVHARINDQPYRVQVLSWVPGQTLRHVRDRPTALLERWGAVAAALSHALADFDHPAAHDHSNWDPPHALQHQESVEDFEDPAQITLATHFFDYFERAHKHFSPELRQSVCYADAHEDNLLVTRRPDYSYDITGLVDVGDAVYTYTVCELAIACAYAAMDTPDPLGAMASVVRGYTRVFPLRKVEIAALYPLVIGRLLTTVTQAAAARVNDPINAYRSISEEQAWNLLTQLRSVRPRLAKYTFRAAGGFRANAKAKTFARWLASQPIIEPILNARARYLHALDFSVGSTALGNYSDYAELPRFERHVQRLLEDAGDAIGYGGYRETRPFYTTNLFQTAGNEGPRWRTVHLGLDLWSPAGEPVYAPFPGRVHSFRQNDGPRDYGATIIIEHRVTVPVTSPGQTNRMRFWTLYGHLSTASLDGLYEGKEVSGGQAFAKTGTPCENGGWPPHLHFQVILDLLGKTGDFPGVAYPEEAKVWASVCPDPAPMSGLVFRSQARSTHHAETPADTPTATTEAVTALRHKHLGRSLSLSYAQPLHIVRGVGNYLLDVTGRRYLDTVNNVAHVGHEHPRVVAAIQRQAAVLNTNTRYLHHEVTAFAAELCATLPPELSVVHFVNSGSEANELALRMARAATGHEHIIAVESGYHGNTAATIDVSSYKFDGPGGRGAPAKTHLVPAPDTYFGAHRNVDTAGAEYAGYLDPVIAQLQAGGGEVAAFVCESILSCGGQVVLPKGYLQAAYAKTRAAGGVCIADEVQVGLGRVGSHFWGFELQHVVPDIVVIGKPLGNGHPLGAVVCTPAVANAFANGMEYFNTFGGNPVSCAAGRAVLRVVREEGLQANALRIGNLLQQRLRDLQQRCESIGDVRGHGLFLGVELVTDREARAPNAALATHLVNRLRERGILTSTDGPRHNVLKVKPPLCFGEREVDFLVEELGWVLGSARSISSR